MPLHTPTHAGHKDEYVRADLSPSLVELDRADPRVQADFWLSVCLTDPGITELDRFGGLPPDDIINDVVNRFFDSSDKGLQAVFDLCWRDQQEELCLEGADKQEKMLTKLGLLDALSEHFQMYPRESELLSDEHRASFDKLCEKITIPCSYASFSYSLRRLRIAMLVKKYQLGSLEQDENSYKKVYHIDYDDDYIFTNFSYSHSREDATVPVRRGRRRFHVPQMAKQAAVMDVAEYLFTSKFRRPGNVHWVHLHRPRLEMILALGQVYRMPGRVQNTMCCFISDCKRTLRDAQPQLQSGSAFKTSKHGDGETDSAAYDWSTLIYPGIYLDNTSVNSLASFERWYHERQDPARRKSMDARGFAGPPPIHVASVEFTIAMVFSDAHTKTLVTMCGVPRYVGRWVTDVPKQSRRNICVSIMDRLTCMFRTKQTQDGYSYALLPQEDDKEDYDVEGNVEADNFKMYAREVPSADPSEVVGSAEGEIATDPEESNINFETIFGKSLQALESQNSLLRTGDNLQLMTRIVLNSTNSYLEVAQLYSAAINRLRFLLNTPATPHKDDLIDKITAAKRELNTLQRKIRPFIEYVVPHLQKVGSCIPDTHVEYQINQVVNNVHAFQPLITSAIDTCDNLEKTYDRDAGDRMNNVLNILTFITFVITPMQLLTGLYGMNFKIIPELQWNYGYHYFWATSISLSILFGCILFCFTREA